MAGAMPAWRLGRLNAKPVPGRPPERDGQADIGLTGGQRRIFAVSRALLLRPAVLLLDEPTTGADPIGRREILERVPLKGNLRTIRTQRKSKHLEHAGIETAGQVFRHMLQRAESVQCLVNRVTVPSRAPLVSEERICCLNPREVKAGA